MQQDKLSCGKWSPTTTAFQITFMTSKTTFQTEFNLLKKTTSKNIENLQEAIQSQQAYTTALGGHIDSLYTKLAQLNRQVQMHCLYPHPQSDVVKLNAPKYNLDIDRQPDPVTIYNH